MKFLVRVQIPNDAGNAFLKTPGWSEKLQGILQDQRAQNTYFLSQDGVRTIMYVTELSDSAGMPAVAEPWWLLTQAEVNSWPVMEAADFGKAAPAIGAIIKKYG